MSNHDQNNYSSCDKIRVSCENNIDLGLIENKNLGFVEISEHEQE